MSISSENNRNDYVGSGSTNEFDYIFLILSSSHLQVIVRDSLGDETILVLNTDYTVAGVGDATGGSIVLIDADQAWLTAGGNLATGYTLSIRRVLPLTQTTDIRNQGSFFPETHEDAFDKSVMMIQQLQDEIDRSLKLSETNDPADFDTQLPPDISEHPNSVIAINATGDGFYLIDITGESTIPSYTDDITIVTAGKGLVVTTPDGLHTWRIRVNNSGDPTTEQVS